MRSRPHAHKVPLRKLSLRGLEQIVKAQGAVDRIEREGDTRKFRGEYTVETPLEVGADGEVLVGLELTAELHAPMEAAEIFREIIGRCLSVGEFRFVSRRVLVADVAIVDESRERAVHHP